VSNSLRLRNVGGRDVRVGSNRLSTTVSAT